MTGKNGARHMSYHDDLILSLLIKHKGEDVGDRCPVGPAVVADLSLRWRREAQLQRKTTLRKCFLLAD